MARYVSASLLADNAAFDRAYERSAAIADETANVIAKSAAKAGAAAAAQAKAAGASSAEQQAAAARTAVSYTEAATKISAAADAAGKAAMKAAQVAGASADEQVAAFNKAVAATREYEAAQKQAADQAASAAKKQADAIAASNARIKGSMAGLAKLGKDSLMAFGAGAAASVYGAVKLQSSMEQLHTQAGVAQDKIKGLTNSVIGLAPSLATGPEALAGSLYHVYSGGVKGADALKVMSIAAKEAKFSGADLNDTTTALTATVYSGIKGAQNYASAMSILNATVGAGDMHFQDLNQALGGPMLATVKGYGLSLRDVGAALATMGDLNIRGADAATQLRMAVQYMAKPAATAGPLLERLGLNTHSFADAMARGGLMPALQLLHDRLQAIGVTGPETAQVIGDLFTKKGASGVTILLNSLDKMHQKVRDIRDASATTFQKDWVAWTGTAAGQADKLKATVQSLADKFGMYLIPKLEAVGQAVSSVVSWFQHNQGAAQALAAIIEGVLAAAVTAFAVNKATAFINGVKGMWGGLRLLGSTLMELPAKFGIVEAAETGMATTTEETAAATDAALGSTGIGLVIVGLSVAATELATHWGSVMGLMKSAVQDMVSVADRALNVLIGGLNDAVSVFNSTIGRITGDIGKINNVGVTPFAGGGVGTGAAKFHRQESAAINQWLHSPIGSPLNLPGQPKGYRQAAENIIKLGGNGPETASNTHSATWAVSLLAAIGAPATKANVSSLTAWINREGNLPSVDRFNPLDTTMGGYGGTPTNSVGVRSYPNWNAGINATAATLKSYPAIVTALKSGAGLGQGGETARELLTWSGGGYSGIGSSSGTSGSGPSLSSSALDNLLNSTSTKAATKRMTVHQREQSTASAVSTIINDDVTRFQGLASSASSAAIAAMYNGVAAQIRALGPKFEAEAKTASTTSDVTKLKDALRQALTHITSGLAAGVALATRAGSLEGRYQNATQNGTVRTLQNALGISSAALPGGASFAHGFLMPGERAPASFHGLIEGLGNAASASAIQRRLGGALAGAAGGQANSRYEQTVEALIRDGQKQQAAQLVAAHRAAMQALALTMYAEQKTKDGEELAKQAQMLNDQTQGLQAWAQDSLNVQKAAEQKRNDIAAAKLQQLVDLQKAFDDQQAGIAQQTKDTATISADVGQGIIDAINDTNQIWVDTIGERGLYGLALIAQQDKVHQDEVKAYWDQQIDLMQKQYDVDQRAADKAESAAQYQLDQVTAAQHAAVALARQKLDTVTMIQDQRITRAQAHADAVLLHEDATKVGPAQIALDLNANASKSVQAKFQAQLTSAQGDAAYQEALANQQLQKITASANSNIQAAQNAFDNVSNNANTLIQNAANNLSNITDQWTNTLATDQANLTGTQTTAGIAEAGAAATTNTASAVASTQFAGSGLTVNVFGVSGSDPTAIGEAASWAIRTAGVATV